MQMTVFTAKVISHTVYILSIQSYLSQEVTRMVPVIFLIITCSFFDRFLYNFMDIT